MKLLTCLLQWSWSFHKCFHCSLPPIENDVVVQLVSQNGGVVLLGQVSQNGRVVLATRTSLLKLWSSAIRTCFSKW